MKMEVRVHNYDHYYITYIIYDVYTLSGVYYTYIHIRTFSHILMRTKRCTDTKHFVYTCICLYIHIYRPQLEYLRHVLRP